MSFTNKAFSRSLSKDKWKELTTSYTQIKDTESLLVAPTMEAGMKEELKKRHGYTKTKELFTFDDGLAERQSVFLVIARPSLAALMALDSSGGEDEDEGPGPDVIKDLLEDALVLLGNANFRLNDWRQKRFSEFLTDVSKRTLQEGIPADKHLFPDKFHAKIKCEHDHSSTNSKLISTPASKHFSKGPHRTEQPFRGNYHTTDNSRVGGKRKWGYGSRFNPQPAKGVLQGGGAASSEISNTAGRLHDETRPEGCILHTSNSSLPQEVYEVHLSGQNIPVSVPSLWPLLSSAGIHKDTEASTNSTRCYRKSLLKW